MNEEMRKKLAEINATKAEVRQLIADGKLDEAETKKQELDAMQRAFNLLLSMEDEDEDAAKAQAKKKRELTDPVQPPMTFARIGQAVVNALGEAVQRRHMDDTDRQIIQDAMKENSDPDGGLTVPQDIQTRIKELRRSDDNLEQYVNVEPVTTMSGSRVIEKEADSTAWPDIDEEGEFTEVETPQFAKIAYKITKKGGKMLCSLELLADTAENILAYLMKWIAKKTRATRNARILACMDAITKGKEVAVTDLDSLKDIFNVMLDPAIAASSAVWTNQDGFNWLDKLKDKDGNYILQSDPTDKTRTLLFGKYTVHVLSNKVLKTTTEASANTNTYPLYCGNLAEAVTLFDREFMTVESSKEAGSVWDKDQLAVKVRDRFDVKAVDEAAIIKGKITVSTAG
jgi:HK97 family phage major capsid protein